MNPPVLVGMAPGKSSDPSLPLFPRPASSAGGRLAVLAGLDWREYLRLYERTNLVNRWPGRSGEGDSWPRAEARIAARAVERLLAGRCVVFVGRNVAEAFERWLGFYNWDADTGLQFRYACIPHPSGRNRMYNDDDHRRCAREVLRHALDPEHRAWIAELAERRMFSRRSRSLAIR